VCILLDTFKSDLDPLTNEEEVKIKVTLEM